MGDMDGFGLFSSASTGPPIQLSLADVMARSEELLGRCGRSGQTGSVPSETTVKAQTTTAMESMEGSGVEGQLREERERTLLGLIEESLERSREALSATHRQAKLSDWERHRTRLAALQPNLPNLNQTLSAPAQRQLSGPGQTGARSSLADVELEFARLVAEHVDSLVSVGAVSPGSLCASFCHLAQRLPREKGHPELWAMVEVILSIPSQGASSARGHHSFTTAQLEASLTFLERGMTEHLKEVVRSSRMEARLGGVPSPEALTSAYLKVAKGGVEPWAQSFYLLRCGEAKSAAVVLETARVDPEFASLFADFAAAGAHGLSPDNANKVRLLYRKVAGASKDPFKKAVYAIVGGWAWGPELEAVAESLEDWLWLRLRPLRASPDHLPQLQALIREEYGEKHFTSGGASPVLYFSALWLSGQLEPAIEFLLRQARGLRVHGVHVALAADAARLLLTPDDPSLPLLHQTETGLPQLNLARAVLGYTAAFETTDPREAINYYYLLRGIGEPKSGRSLLIRSLSSLLQRTGEVELVLGRRERSGRRMPGLVERLGGGTDLLAEVAGDAEEKGRTEMAVRLYDLAESHGRVLRLLNGLLAGVVATPPSPQSPAERITDLAVCIGARYRREGCSAPASDIATFHLLLDLLTFFKLHREGKHTEALEVLGKLEQVPQSPDAVDSFLKRFYLVPEEVRGLLGSLLLAAMQSLCAEVERLTAAGAPRPVGLLSRHHPEGIASTGRAWASALLDYAGRLPFRLPPDLHASLVQLQLRLH